MDLEGKLQSAVRNLIEAERALRKAASVHPALEGPSRAFGRIARAANRPLRLGILGESNSGKSSLANLLAGVATLPALPVANTRLPTLLTYSPAPFVMALYETGERITLSASVPAQQGAIKRLEVGLPASILRSVEILDFPGSANVLLPAARQDPLGYGIDAAIWTTVATQAWRESERIHWLALPQKVRSHSVLAVTFCDVIGGGEADMKRLQARLEQSARPYFREICYVGAGDAGPAAAASGGQALFAQVRGLAREFASRRLEKASAIARRLADHALKKLEG
jgi:energy-coupling factor transporter ATP-binding protein EcfA2